MAATQNFISDSVGEGKRNKRADAERLQQLLTAAGFDAGPDDGNWNKPTAQALHDFRQKHNPEPWALSIDPGSPDLLTMARLAEILIPMPRKKGMAGVEEVHQWFRDNAIEYDSERNRSIYGITGEHRYAVQRRAQNGPNAPVKFLRGPVKMDCTTYVNLMLSVYIHGNVDRAPYDGDCGQMLTPGTMALRYGFERVSRRDGKTKVDYFKGQDQIERATEDIHGYNPLFIIEVQKKEGENAHMALIYENYVYEYRKKAPYCTKRTLGGEDGFVTTTWPTGEFYLYREKVAVAAGGAWA